MPNNWSIQQLDELRHIMDAEADAAIKSIYGSRSGGALRTVLMNLASNDSKEFKQQFAGTDTPHQLYDLINKELTHEFSKQDLAMFEKTHRIWKEHGIQFILILFFRSLVYTYAAEKPGNVLRMTKLLEDQPARRIIETGQFVFDVMDEKWWEPDKRGILTSVKIRLMHSAMRYMILGGEGDEPWQTDKWGMPISQEDLIATNQVFSLEFFKGLSILGDPMSAEDQEAWFYTWKKIGKMMGVQDNLLMPDVASGWDLQLKVYAHLFNDEPSAGIGLAAALVKTMGKLMMGERLVLAIMKKMLTDENYPDTFSKLLGPTYGERFPELFAVVSDPGDASDIAQTIHENFFKDLEQFLKDVKDHRVTELIVASAGGNTEPVASEKATPPAHEGLLHRLSDDLKKGIDKLRDFGDKELSLIDVQLKTIELILHEVEKSKVGKLLQGELQKINEELMRKAMCAIGGILVDILSKVFRPGKKAGFRISANLKEHWAIR
jgi:hypothetical protein